MEVERAGIAADIINGVTSRRQSIIDARMLEDEIERRDLVKEYIFHLDKLVTYPNEESWQGYRWGILRATPAQRARAFLKAVEG